MIFCQPVDSTFLFFYFAELLYSSKLLIEMYLIDQSNFDSLLGTWVEFKSFDL